jgi:hypothetical protein
MIRRLHMCMAGAAVLFTLAVVASPARADILSLPGNSCASQVPTTPFLPWLDLSSYVLAPGGSFEPGDAAWSASGGAHEVAGNEPWHVNGGTGANSMQLPPGSSVTSPAMCASLTRPTLRFFARSTGGSLLSTLRVDVLFKTTLGLLSSLTVGTVTVSPQWSPTLPFVYLINALALLGPNYQVVAFRFVPQGDATWQIDDVYIDPWSKG